MVITTEPLRTNSLPARPHEPGRLLVDHWAYALALAGFAGSGASLVAAVLTGHWSWIDLGWLMGLWLVMSLGWIFLSPPRWRLLGWGALQTLAATALLILQPELVWLALSIGLSGGALMLWGQGLRLSRTGALLALISGLLLVVGAALQMFFLAAPALLHDGLQLAALLLPVLLHAVLAMGAVQQLHRQLRLQKLQMLALEQQGRSLDEDRLRLLQQLREQGAAAGTDALTGVDNFARSLDAINLLRERHARKVEPFCVVLLELDPWIAKSPVAEQPNRPSLNDKLQLMLSGLLITQLRALDHVGRYHHNAFLLVLEDTNAMHAIAVLHRIRDSMRHGQWGEARSLNAAAKQGLTLTMAVAEYRSGETAEQMFERAEAALQHGHASGYDQIVVAGSNH